MIKRTTALFLCALALPLPALASGKAVPSSLSQLSDAERSYYDQIFGYTMDNINGGQTYSWASYSGNGTIHVQEVFMSKSGYPCRDYSETFKVQGIDGAYHGTACKRQGKDGWCRLKPGNANTCAMEDPSFMFSMPSMSLPDVNVGPVGNPLAGVNTPSVPSINTNVNIDKPKGPKMDNAGSDFATSVTGNAGKAAGSAASNGISWFGKTFGR
jgi:hypothetical protein